MSRLARQRYIDRQVAQRAIAAIWMLPGGPFVRAIALQSALCTMVESTAEWLSAREQQRHPDAPSDWAQGRLIRDAYYAFEGAARFWRAFVSVDKAVVDELLARTRAA